jgi:hypothetical protein
MWARPEVSAIAKAATKYSEVAIGDEIVVMRLDTGDFFSLTGTSAAIWQLIDGKRDRAALLEALAEDYDADAPSIADDLDEFIKALAEQGLLARS